MEKAIVKIGKSEIYVEASNFFKDRDYLYRKNHLICSTQGCNCKLSYVNSTFRKQHFKTYINQKHKEFCPNHKENIKERFKEIKINDVSGYFSEEAINSRMKNGFKKFLSNSDTDIEIDKKPIVKTKPIKDKEAKVKSTYQQGIINFDNLTVTFDKSEVRLPNIRHKSINDLDEKDIGRPCFIYGYIESITKKGNNLFEMTLEYETKKMNIYIQEAYFKSTLLQGIESSLKGLKNYIFSGNNVMIGCLSLLKNEDNSLIANISDYNSLYIKDTEYSSITHLPLLSFMANVSRRNLI
ncbi:MULTISPECIES: hypothetical protein [Mammaliicoccus]|uniref:hypothetical protein n=1 Tax=Mammaliicoccus TaxID=2803850 RepID=UPI000D1CE583|nr:MULTISPECIES: hypothetical protein [Mammaliicoccus]PTE34247.1 hypothetical protein BUY94_04450 [Mammaliicoccus fleurettii]